MTQKNSGFFGFFLNFGPFLAIWGFFCNLLGLFNGLFLSNFGALNPFPNHDHDGDDDYDESENDISDNDLLEII